MDKEVIADTSCLIIFEKIGEMQLLTKTYGEIIITPEVLREFGKTVPEWIKQKKVKDTAKQRDFENLVDKGEASAIALALELKNSILIIDDKRGRRLAKDRNIKITGTFGTLLRAKNLGVITHIKPIIDKLISTNFRISKEIVEGVLKRAGE